MKIVIVAGGTGGHLYPGIALARELQGHDILFVVRRGDLGREILRKEGLSVKEISGQGLPRSLSWRALSFPLQFARGWIESRALLREFRPDWVVGMGGYLSVPVILMARALRIPTLLHEQNVCPGLANRFLGRFAQSVAVSFSASLSRFPARKAWVSGLPIRADIGTADSGRSRQEFGLEPGVTTILVFGGSLGAVRINEISRDVFVRLAKEGLHFQVLHITGPKSFEAIQKGYQGLPIRAVILPYCHMMAQAYAAADWVVCRAGASSVAELIAARRPATLIPYPWASNDHQRFNAEILSALGVADVILEKDLTAEAMAKRLRGIVADPGLWMGLQPLFERCPDGGGSLGAAQRLAEFLTGRKP